MRYDMSFVTVNAIQHETFDTVSLTLALPTDVSLDGYQAGQYVILSLIQNGKSIRRSYSIVEIVDRDKCWIKITVKRIENGLFSRIINDQTRIGDQFGYEGIAGFFTLPELMDDITAIYCYAAGSGITAIYAILNECLQKHPKIKVHLTYSSKSPEKTIFQSELNELLSLYLNRFQVDFFYSESKNILNARINNSTIARLLEKKDSQDYNNQLFFICGPLEYMDTVMIALLTEGVPKRNIRKELFNTFEIETNELPPDLTPRIVTFHIKNNQPISIEVAYPNSILTAAQEHNLPLPYSCGSGQCGSCTAKILRGEVWMAYNEVLTDREIEQGLTLTCRGFPINGDVELAY